VVDPSRPRASVDAPHASERPILGVDTGTAGMLGVTDHGPVDAELVTRWADFTGRFGDCVTLPEPGVHARWTMDAVEGGQWWHFGAAVKGFFDNGGERVYVKRVVARDAGALCIGDFLNALAAFERWDDVSTLLVPGMWSLQLHAALLARCEASGRFLCVLDAPVGADADEVRTFRSQRHSRFAALYYPWVAMRRPPTGEPVVSPVSAHIAGVYARVDRERGVFKAPANEALHAVEGVARHLTPAEAEKLQRDGINTLRTLDGAIRVWGARTLSSGEWHYVNVRRLVTFVHDSIASGTRWVVFEPNGEPLWAQLRRSVMDFLLQLWRAGGLAGATAEQAFFVRCDRTTMSQDDLDQGRLVCEIGIAPLRPAEFVIVRIGQWTADGTGSGDSADDDRLVDPPYVRCESSADCEVLRQAIVRDRRGGTLVLVSGAERHGRLAAAAEVPRLAQRRLYRIDLSRVVGKYIGETEQALDRIFAAAARTDGLLFLEEADAVFGKRGEVRDARDRYASLESAYLLQRIEAFPGIVALATVQRADAPVAVRRLARLAIEANAHGVVRSAHASPDLANAVDLEVVSTHLRACRTLYNALMLEATGMFAVVDRLVELFRQGLLPLGTGHAGSLLAAYGEAAATRLSTAQRRELYVRVFGNGGGGDGEVASNEEFAALWMRFVSLVAAWVPPADPNALRGAARDLAINLSLHGDALSRYAADDLAETVRDAVAVLRAPDLQAVYGARDMWQVVERVATLELRRAPDTQRHRTMAASGAVAIGWLAAKLARLAPDATGAVLEPSGSTSASEGTGEGGAPWDPTDADLVVACRRWLGAYGQKL
jgi:hypothetical protein